MTTQVHRMFYHYSEYPLSLRTLYSGTLVVLGVGYLFAMLHLYNTHAWRDGEPGLSAQDLVVAYSGKDGSKLEAALLGPMSDMVEQKEKSILLHWLDNDAGEEEYDEKVKDVIESNCVPCHNETNPHMFQFDSFEKISKYTKVDTGAEIFTLVRVSHIHLFGITFIFFIMGLIFSHAFFRPVWLKSTIIMIPFIAIVVDIGSWYVTKVYPPFAWVVMISGAMMGLSFATMWVISFYQIWFTKLPQNVVKLPDGVQLDRREKMDLG